MSPSSSLCVALTYTRMSSGRFGQRTNSAWTSCASCFSWDWSRFSTVSSRTPENALCYRNPGLGVRATRGDQSMGPSPPHTCIHTPEDCIKHSFLGGGGVSLHHILDICYCSGTLRKSGGRRQIGQLLGKSQKKREKNKEK